MIVQRMKRMHAACKRKLKVKVTGLGYMTLQHGQSDVVTRPYSENKLPFVQRIGNDTREIGA